jgi:hypothetical protein
MEYRDSKALIKAWARAQTAKAVKDLDKIDHDMENTWPKAAQTIATQIRTNNVKWIGKWPRRFDTTMPHSCRFCCKQDHTQAQEVQQPGPRSSRDPVQCTTCGHTYADASKYNRHLDGKGKEQCKRTQTPVFIKNTRRDPEQPAERRPSSGVTETLTHLWGCAGVEQDFSWRDTGPLSKIILIAKEKEKEN